MHIWSLLEFDLPRKQIHVKYGKICVRENKSTRKLIPRKLLSANKINPIKIYEFSSKYTKHRDHEFLAI